MMDHTMTKNPDSIPYNIWPAEALRLAEREAADSLGLTLFELMQRAGEAAQLFFGACARAGLEPRMTVTYGGSDNNHFCLHGLQGLVVAPGMNSCHSCQEYTSVDELTRAAKLAEALIRE